MRLSMRSAAAGVLAVALSSSIPVLAQAHEMGHHSMSGTITSLNKRTGFMHVHTAMGTMVLHFPPSSESHLKKGERIRTYLGFSPLS